MTGRSDPPTSPTERFERLRAEIERIDRRLVEEMGRRLEVARRVGRAKREAGVPLQDPSREADVVRRAGALAREFGLDEDSVRHVFWCLIRQARDAQVEDR